MTTVAEPETKRCTRCHTTKPTSEFGLRSTGSKDGLASWCRTCTQEVNRESRARRREQRTKLCTECGSAYPREEFPRDWNEPDRRSPVCGPCTAVHIGEAVLWTAAAAQPAPRPEPEPEPEPAKPDSGTDWRHRAACRGKDGELWFPIGGSDEAVAQTEEAKSYCRRCPSMESCLQWALETGQDSGVWGGMSEDERRALKRRAARNRASASA